MNDPREILAVDPYNNITSDEEDEQAIARELEFMERKRQALVERLKRKQEFMKPQDPNFEAIEVPQSPTKNRVKVGSHNATQQGTKFEGSNINKVRLSQLQQQPKPPASTTTYFMEKFQNAKKNEDKQIAKFESMMNARVHTFSTDEKKYVPIITNELESFSNLWVKKRYIPEDDLKRALHEIKILRLGKLFAKIRPPKFQEPEYANWATIGLISHKSDIKFTSSEKPVKFFMFTITDFQHILDVYIFGKKGVERYYNLRLGDVIAILNPEVLPWRPSGRGNFIKSFNLRISHDFKCILEIGSSRDLGWCPIVNKKTHKKCGSPINISLHKCCDYHREVQFRGTSAKRIELNGGYALGAPTKVDSQPSLYKTKGENGFNIIKGTRKRLSEEEERLKKSSHNFTNSNSAKAFFDEKFQNPDMLANLDNKRRKIMETKKSTALSRELGKIMRRRESSGLEDKSAGERQKMKQTTESALQTGLIQRLGFDPTHGKISQVLKSSVSGSEPKNNLLGKKKTVINDLLHYKKEKVILAPSKNEWFKKRSHREEVWQKHFGSKETKETSDGSASDLEII
ncbi:CEI_1a_G0025660.mRNA.1.CDS.1 [Saccharomyces cerevisiae]|nr:EM14S01-3B_G0051850.mRNA.1.CDS.1 [Saccharomyces cerevisiae]CAI4380672.1 AMH_1a_G0025730.mRNA.1.CDS.1 [Saccharomyces cerevisiae]CAI4389706.1 CEI_1a_G0025660.mRNA.1.CDS.1 [Saccharomyces cerevisiae]CAI6595427.1 AMH_1a_G0025730.mRNA.1.CDS.1 [Saccharomyces cerevisiae]CAI7233952.1 CEI_1a_G0025660.mRNA.1.CDS.1 [Saccharomyces cerevisiae]